VERFSWQFGDGSAVQQTREDQTTHVYREAGVKTLTVTADLSNGYRLAAGRSVQVSPMPD